MRCRRTGWRRRWTVSSRRGSRSINRGSEGVRGGFEKSHMRGEAKSGDAPGARTIHRCTVSDLTTSFTTCVYVHHVITVSARGPRLPKSAMPPVGCRGVRADLVRAGSTSLILGSCFVPLLSGQAMLVLCPPRSVRRRGMSFGAAAQDEEEAMG